MVIWMSWPIIAKIRKPIVKRIKIMVNVPMVLSLFSAFLKYPASPFILRNNEALKADILYRRGDIW
uniref:Uncharacterized protein n=1 Tax=Megaselia scalaris TaxID=36166 RepID=T1H4X2_MEGSC